MMNDPEYVEPWFERATLYRRALDLWGTGEQFAMLAEKCAELIVATNHWRRHDTAPVDELITEIADVQIMLEQIMVAAEVRPAEVEIGKQRKIQRLRDRVRTAEHDRRSPLHEDPE